jgi:hypothetical protein
LNAIALRNDPISPPEGSRRAVLRRWRR